MGLFSRTKKDKHGHAPPQQQLIQPQHAAAAIPWDGTKFKIQLKMAKGRIELQRGKKDNEIESIRRKIAQHLVDEKEPLARILGDRVLREKTMLISFDIIETCIEVLISSNNNLSMNNNLQNTPNDLKESVASVVFCSSRVNIPELLTVVDILKNHFGHHTIQEIINCTGPYKSFINEILIIQLDGNPPDGYLILQELSHVATQHNINWTPPPEETDLNSFGNNNNNNNNNNHFPSAPPGGGGDYGVPEHPPMPSNIPGYSSNFNPIPSAPPAQYAPTAPPPEPHFPMHTPQPSAPEPDFGINEKDNDADLQARFNNILDK